MYINDISRATDLVNIDQITSSRRRLQILLIQPSLYGWNIANTA